MSHRASFVTGISFTQVICAAAVAAASAAVASVNSATAPPRSPVAVAAARAAAAREPSSSTAAEPKPPSMRVPTDAEVFDVYHEVRLRSSVFRLPSFVFRLGFASVARKTSTHAIATANESVRGDDGGRATSCRWKIYGLEKGGSSHPQAPDRASERTDARSFDSSPPTARAACRARARARRASTRSPATTCKGARRRSRPLPRAARDRARARGARRDAPLHGARRARDRRGRGGGGRVPKGRGARGE